MEDDGEMHADSSLREQLTAHIDRGWELMGRGDFASAMASARKCLELDPDAAEAHYLLGHAHAQLGNPEEALECYEQALELDETFYEAMVGAAEVLVHSLGNHREALRYLDDALDYAENPDETTDALLLRADAQLIAGDPAGAASGRPMLR